MWLAACSRGIIHFFVAASQFIPITFNLRLVISPSVASAGSAGFDGTSGPVQQEDRFDQPR
jgi:hypothetical protein